MRVYIGFDGSEARAYDVAVSSLRRRASAPVEVIPLRADRLASTGLLRRPTDTRDGIYDLISNARASTEFAISRFIVPHLGQSGFVLFCDCDVLFMADVAELFALADARYAVQLVKHHHRPTSDTKMVTATQTAYGRKNWSSVMLWNCDHPANQRLSLGEVNARRGLELHQFYWLHDSEIGELPAGWNWLVNEMEQPAGAKLAHFTNGGPWLPGWEPRPHDELWLAEEAAAW